MELDDMKLAWQALNRQLERQQTLSTQLFLESRLDKVRHGLRPLFWGQVLQIVFGALISVMAASFWVSRVTMTPLLLWGVLVHVLGIFMIVAGARNLYLLQRIDYSAPILDIQRRIAQLRAWRARVEGPASAVLGAVVWVPLIMIELVRNGLNPDSVTSELGSYLVISGVVSLGLVLLAYGLIRYFGQRRWLENNWAGTSVQRAESMLEDIARFMHE
ncbi:hypothetical protein DWU98_01990 [Dyella monticola]|uniref:Serine/threonine protein kinase n=1 Tax=Dyella monticola TaxID=1927958 RepID=A0A370X901_9GAMM|nr:hypothetical protein [Dyella monticola]RDS84757.1 hypothetical protein DWU98_01990 [Dyella monticola]